MQATTTKPEAATPPPVQPPVPAPGWKPNLGDVISRIDEISQDALCEISAIAHVALLFMETDEFYNNPFEMARLLSTMKAKADETQAAITYEASEVGHARTDVSEERRFAAWRRSKPN